MKNESILRQTRPITKMEWIVNFSLLEDTRNFLVTYGFIYDNTLTSRSLVPTRTFLVNPGPGHPTNYWSNTSQWKVRRPASPTEAAQSFTERESEAHLSDHICLQRSLHNAQHSWKGMGCITYAADMSQ